MLTRRERLMATLHGKLVDRPAVNFYEIGGYSINPDDPDPFNVYNSPSWRPLLELAEEHTDLIRLGKAAESQRHPAVVNQFYKRDTYTENGSMFYRSELSVAGRTFTSLVRRDPEVNTLWTLQHFLSDADDLKSYLELPDEVFETEPDVSSLIAEDEAVADRGIIMVDTADPLCIAADLFSMEDYTIVALTEQELFHQLLEKLSRNFYSVTEKVAAAFPGHLWRIYGPEYATEPYLPPHLYKEYVVKYTGPMIEMIKKHGGYARIHSHGRIKNSLPYIVEMGADALDPIEPAPQGDVELADVRREYGRDMVLFGNLEVCDIENMDPSEFERVAAKSMEDGTSGNGRGFVLMPSAGPYGREITPKTMANYETMVRLVGGL